MEQPDRSTWWGRVLTRMYKFTMIVLCVTNTFFLIHHICDLQIVLWDETTLILTIIGFLFAFAGINIYSIFNTNIEDEKEKLRELHRTYKEEIDLAMTHQQQTRQLMKYSQISLILAHSKHVDGQTLENLLAIRKLLREAKDFIFQAYKERRNREAQVLQADLIDLSRGIYKELSFFEQNITGSKSGFWGRSENDIKKLIIETLRELLRELKSIETYDFRDRLSNGIKELKTSEEDAPQSLKQRIAFAATAIANIFRCS